METEYVYAILAAFAVLFLVKKNKAVEAQSENLKTKEELLKVQEQVIKVEGQLETEEEKRKRLEENMQKKIAESLNLNAKDIADFFNKRS